MTMVAQPAIKKIAEVFITLNPTNPMQTEDKSWEQRFDEKFSEQPAYSPDEIKSFISSLLEEERQRIISLIEDRKKTDPGADGEYDGAIMYGWNQALSELKDKIK